MREIQQRRPDRAPRARACRPSPSPAGAAGRLARHVAGMRTTTPALSRSAALRKQACGLRGVQRSGWKISPASTIGRSQAHVSAARCTGSSSDSSLLAVRRAGVFAQRLASGTMLRPGLRRKPRRVGRHEGERRLRVAAVLGQVEMHAADQVPGRVQRP